MTYELAFKKSALKEWKKLGVTIQAQFKKKLTNILNNPHIKNAKLSGGNKLYKIKLRQAVYRLVYEVNDTVITVTVISVGKRDKGKAYKVAMGTHQLKKLNGTVEEPINSSSIKSLCSFFSFQHYAQPFIYYKSFQNFSILALLPQGHRYLHKFNANTSNQKVALLSPLLLERPGVRRN